MSLVAADTRVYFHVAAINDYANIVDKIFNKIKDSGLYEKVSKINILYIGPKNACENLPHSNKVNLVHYSENLSYCEFPTLHWLWKDSIHENFNALYIHTKNVSRSSFRNDDWTDYMTYFCIEDYEKRLADLIISSSSGVEQHGFSENLHNDPHHWGWGVEYAPVHYSGNFWWARSDYLRTLAGPMDGWCPEGYWKDLRHMAEMWVCSGEGSHAEAWNSGVLLYTTKYPRINYTKG